MTHRLLDDLDHLLDRFVAFPSDHDRYAVAAWVLHCWTLDAYESTPRLALLSPEKGSGKTRCLEVLELVVPNPKNTVNMSGAVLFRLVGGDDRVTLLMDEADTYLGWKVAREHEDVRGLVNAGHRRGASAYRMQMEGGATVQEFPAFAPVALAGIGDLPDTIIDRSIVVAMKRRAPSEHVEPFRRRLVAPAVTNLVESIETWAADVDDDLIAIIDNMDLPDGVVDRPADVWEPLIAIADHAGGVWSSRLRTAAVALNARREERDPSLGIQLLRDIRTIFADLDDDRIASAGLADRLVDIEGAPWANLRGNPIDANGVARRLRPYEVRPGSHWFGDGSGRGYLLEDFYDAFMRYLPPLVARDSRDGRDESGSEPSDSGPGITPITGITAPQGGNAPDKCSRCGRLSPYADPCRDCAAAGAA